MDNLPDNLVIYILSFLPVRDLTQCRAISNRFRVLADSFLDGRLRVNSRIIGEDPRVRRLFSNALDQLWTKLVQKKKMAIFHLLWDFSDLDLVYAEKNSIIRWVRTAVACNVRVMSIHLRSGSLPLPVCVYELESLEYLSLRKINLRNLHEIDARFSSLEVISLSWVTVSESPLLGQWITKNCPRLKELTVEYVDGVQILNLSSTSLEKLRIANWREDGLLQVTVSAERLKTMIFWFVNSANGRSTSLRIAAQNLESLSLGGEILDQYQLGNLNNLQEAYLYYTGYDPFQNTTARTVDQNLIEIVRGVSWTRRIISHEFFIKPLIERRLQQFLAIFVRAESLSVGIYSQNFPFRIITSLVEALFRNLRIINLTCSKIRMGQLGEINISPLMNPIDKKELSRMISVMMGNVRYITIDDNSDWHLTIRIYN
ncbi:conserved hypothetical protein [Ricinus communis]|uniref:F-box domain-containing protein n=1 Tax=Ricinus communis TaxID=3988 RepID=B9SXU2_RICCO|nr:conserved hypothetical protein [Ricinus communis]